MNKGTEENEIANELEGQTVITVCDNPVYGIDIGDYDETTFAPLTPEQWLSEIWSPLRVEKMRAYCQAMGYDVEVQISHDPACAYGDENIIASVNHYCEQNWVDWLDEALPSADEPCDASDDDEAPRFSGALRSILLTLIAIAATVAIVSIPV